MGDNEGLVSVIVPIYNREYILKECVESILKQSFKQLQLVLVDDGSTDKSLSLCKDYAKKDNRIFVIHQKNSGPASARNAGLNVAKGSYIMFVDSDDSLHPNCIEILFNAIRRFDTDIAICEHGNRNQKLVQYPKVSFSLSDSKVLLSNGLNDKETILYCWAKLWKRDIIKSVRFKSFSFCEDNLFVVEALLNSQGNVVQVHGMPLYYYLRKNDSITNNLSDENLFDSLKVANSVLKETANSSSFEVQTAAINYCINTAFFAYLQDSNEEDNVLVKKQALKMIYENRKKALFSSSSLKTKVACLISYFSMNAVQLVYSVIIK